MPQLLFAALILCAGYYLLKFFAGASPARVARAVRVGGGALAGLGGLFLLLRGRPDLGIAGIGFGLWLAGFFRLPGRRPFARARASGSGQSAAKSATISVELDHATGAIRGHVIGGPQAGRALEELTRTDCEALLRWCQSDDPDGARLLEAYLDRRFPAWREARQAEENAGRSGRGRATGLSEKDAYEVLGLAEGATRADVVRAHRALMKKFHPDHGGATDLAARVNEAKEVLLRRFE